MSSRKSRLPPSKHHLQSPNDPPSSLTSTQHIARISKPHGNAIYTVELPSKSDLVVELPMRFRNAVWVRRGGFVLIDTEEFTEGKVAGEIVEVIMDEKRWRKLEYWPVEFKRKEESSDDEDEVEGKEDGEKSDSA